jgi:hypothetical protein
MGYCFIMPANRPRVPVFCLILGDGLTASGRDLLSQAFQRRFRFARLSRGCIAAGKFL